MRSTALPAAIPPFHKEPRGWDRDPKASELQHVPASYGGKWPDLVGHSLLGTAQHGTILPWAWGRRRALTRPRADSTWLCPAVGT